MKIKYRIKLYAPSDFARRMPFVLTFAVLSRPLGLQTFPNGTVTRRDTIFQIRARTEGLRTKRISKARYILELLKVYPL